MNTTNIITINIRTDRFPEETSWSWAMRTGSEICETLDEGNPLQDSTLFSCDKDVEPDSIYRLTLENSLADGT